MQWSAASDVKSAQAFRMANGKLASSFRDPSGFMYVDRGVLLRQVNQRYKQELQLLESSGLYAELTAEGLLVPHVKEDLKLRRSDEAFAILKPEVVPTISYPYEWSFSQLKDAALATLKIQKKAMAKGMSLRDASAFNIQFDHGKPMLIDTLSFGVYEEGKPWIAYRQFCQHFLAPLALMSKVDVRLSKLSRGYIDGIPLDLASAMLKKVTRFDVGIGMHIHLHGKAQKGTAAEETTNKVPQRSISRNQMLGLIDSLESTVKKLTWAPEGTVWGDYYAHTNYTAGAFDEKKHLVSNFLDKIDPIPTVAWDLGANNGEFSRICTSKGIQTVAWDIDPAAVEQNYLRVKKDNEQLMLPLIQDLTNPSPGLGWGNKERESLQARGPADVVLALALIHHLAIGNNVPLSDVASYFADLGEWLIIEFVPKDDSQVQRMLASREDIFDRYTKQDFERDFAEWFETYSAVTVPGTVRTLYLMRRLPQG